MVVCQHNRQFIGAGVFRFGGCERMKGGGSSEMMKSWRGNDVAAKKAARRPKSGNCQLGSGPLVRAKRRAEMKNGGK